MERFNPDNFDDFKPHLIRSAHSALFRSAKIGRPGQLQAQIDIVIDSTLINPQYIELFNYFNSISHTANSSTSSLTPFDLYELKNMFSSATVDGCDIVINGGVNLIDYIFWDKNGNLVFYFNDNEKVVISCRQCSYRSLVESSSINIFRINKSRIVYTQDSQIDNPLYFIRKTFLGLEKSTIITPRSFFRPDQFQKLIVDIPLKYDIDGERGIKYLINSGTNQRVTMSLFISRYNKQTFN